MRAAELLAGEEPPTSAREAKATLLDAVDEVADELGNTRTVARARYVHPAVPAAYEAGRLGDWWADGPTRAAAGLQPDERAPAGRPAASTTGRAGGRAGASRAGSGPARPA